MLNVGRYLNSGIVTPGDPFSTTPVGHAKDNSIGWRWGWVRDLRTNKEFIIHDKNHIGEVPIDGNVLELVRGIRLTPAGRWPKLKQLIVFERRDTPDTRRYERSVSGWVPYEAYVKAWMQLIRERIPYQHQPAVNRLVKLLLRQAAGDPIRISQAYAQFEELLKLGCPARLLLDIEALFCSNLTSEEINNPLDTMLALAPS